MSTVAGPLRRRRVPAAMMFVVVVVILAGCATPSSTAPTSPAPVPTPGPVVVSPSASAVPEPSTNPNLCVRGPCRVRIDATTTIPLPGTADFVDVAVTRTGDSYELRWLGLGLESGRIGIGGHVTSPGGVTIAMEAGPDGTAIVTITGD